MQNKYTKIVAKVMAAATIASMFATVSPAMAASPTLMKDTLDREKISVSATHSLSMTLPAPGITTGATLTVTYTGFGSDFAGTPTVTCGAGSATAGFATNVLTLTGGGTACTGTLTVTPFTGTNPGTSGSKTITIGGTSGPSGTFAIPIVDEDQITVTATVDPSITFDLSAQTAACVHGSLAATYTVALGTLTTAIRSSLDQAGAGTAGVQGICVQLDTNAANGAVVTVMNDSPFAGADGHLTSTSVATDNIPATADVTASTSGYNLCVNYISRATTTPAGTFQSTGDWGDATLVGSAGGTTSTDCAGATDGTTTALDGTSQSVLNSGSDGIGTGLARLLVKAAISGTQPAHADYTATLTFIATGTF